MDSIDIFPWDDNFNTGLLKVDEQHRKLVQLLNMLASHVAFKADDFQLSRLFDELAAYAVYHFETEEAIWRNFLADDPAELDHRVTHQSFVDEVSRLKAALGSTSEDRLAEEALGFLARWLASHILETDRYMAYAVLGMQKGMSRDLAKRQATEQMGGATRALIDIILSIYSTLSTNTLRLMRELAERRQAEILLRRETESIKAFLHFASDGIHILDINGNVVECSNSFSAMLGYGREEVIGMNVRRWDAGFDDLALQNALRQLLENPARSQFETQHRRRDGSVFDVEISGYPFKIGEQRLLFCASREITERKQLDRRVVESEANLRMFFNTIDDFLFVLDGNGCILQTNRIVSERLGYSEAELLGQSVLFVHPPDRRAEAQQVVADMLAKKCDYCPVPLQTRDGHLIPVETRVVSGQWNGAPALFGVSRDVTQQMEAQKALEEESRIRRNLLDELKEREFFLRQSQQIGKLGGWRADPVKNTVMWTEGVYEIVEMPKDFKPDLEVGLDFYLPESRERVVENLQRTLQTGEPFSIQVQVRGNRSGDIKWTQLRGMPHHNEDGSVDYLMGTLQDITEQKRIDQALQKSVTFNDSLIETMVDGIAVCHFISEEPFVRFTLWNQAMQALTGYDLGEINRMGWYQTVYVDPDLQDAARRRMDRMRQGDNLDREEWVITCKNGEKRTVEISTVILDRTDGVPNVMAIMRDVTSRKRDEELLRISAQYVRSLIEASLDPLVTISAEGKIDDVNHATEVVTGMDRSQLIGSDFSNYFTDPDKARVGYLKVFEEGQVIDYPLAIRHLNGHITEVLYNATVYRNADGSVGGVFAAARDITERTRTEQALRESEQRFKDYSGASSDWFWETDEELRFSYFSEKAQEVLGVGPEHLLGRKREELASSDDLDDGKWKEHLSNLAQHKPFRNFEYHVRNDFGGRWFSISGVPHFDAEGRFKGYRGIGSNITARKAAELELEEHRRHLEVLVERRTSELMAVEARATRILESAADGLYGVDSESRITFINPAACKMLGYTVEQAMGRPAHELFHHSYPDGRPYPAAECLARQGWQAGRESRVDDETYWHADGHPVPVTVASRPIVENDKIVGAVVSVVDVSTQRAATQAREQALIAAENLARARSEFLANMSHEIRTPMNGVLGFAQIGKRHYQNPEKALGAFEKILISGNHLLGVVNEILDFSKIDAGKLQIEETEMSVDEVLEGAIALVADRARSKGLVLNLEKAPDLPPVCLGDPLRLGQVLLNLLTNAVKFTEAGSITLYATLESGRLVFRVTDTGIGMTAEQLGYVFNPFQQADGSTTRKFGGTGLGLAICKRLVELMKGKILVESTLGAGSRFEVSLPYVEQVLRSTRTTAAKGMMDKPLAGISILLAEDDEVNQMMLEVNLLDDGAHLVMVRDGAAAVERVIADGADAYDVVLMDLQMPVMDGYEATRRILELAPGLPIIGQTAHAFGEDRDKCLAVGMSGHIAKPIDPQALAKLILQVIAAKDRK